LIDLHTRLAGHPEWFPDTVHPNSKGMAAMAGVVFEMLVGGPPPLPPPRIELTRLPPNRLVAQWPAPWAGWVVQSAPSLRLSNTAWTLVEAVPASDGTVVRQTNTATGASRCYRLWQP
jgi:hypothetical protein